MGQEAHPPDLSPVQVVDTKGLGYEDPLGENLARFSYVFGVKGHRLPNRSLPDRR